MDWQSMGLGKSLRRERVNTTTQRGGDNQDGRGGGSGSSDVQRLSRTHSLLSMYFVFSLACWRRQTNR